MRAALCPVDYLGGKDCTWCNENDGRMTVRRARMLWLGRPAGGALSRHASVTRCDVAAAALLALKWVAMASAMITKLPLNMLTPDTGPELVTLKTRGTRAIRQRPRVFGSLHDFGAGGPLNSVSMTIATRSPTPRLLPASGIPPEMPNSERRRVPCAEKPMRACGSIGCPT
jgi:hypothetical protein